MGGAMPCPQRASDTSEELTALGYHLAALPVDVRVGKLILFGAMFGCIVRDCVTVFENPLYLGTFPRKFSVLYFVTVFENPLYLGTFPRKFSVLYFVTVFENPNISRDGTGRIPNYTPQEINGALPTVLVISSHRACPPPRIRDASLIHALLLLIVP